MLHLAQAAYYTISVLDDLRDRKLISNEEILALDLSLLW